MNKEPIWKTRDGQEVKVSDMKDSHLLFADRMVRNKIVGHRELLDLAFSAFAPQGEMACDDFDKALEQSFEEESNDRAWEHIFAKEIKRRGLSALPCKKFKPLPEVESIENCGNARIIKLKKAERVVPA